MFCFVTENTHACQGPDTASDEGKEKKCGFRNPPAVFNGPASINAENNKSGRIDNNKIND